MPEVKSHLTPVWDFFWGTRGGLFGLFGRCPGLTYVTGSANENGFAPQCLYTATVFVLSAL